MTAREFLRQARDVDNQIKLDLNELTKLRSQLYTISSPQYGGRVSHTRSTRAPYEFVLERLWEQEDILSKDLERLENKRAEISEVISSVGNGEEMLILQYHYFDGLRWEEIAQKLNVSERTVRRRHESALKKISKNPKIDR